jgi:hypothetical protein
MTTYEEVTTETGSQFIKRTNEDSSIDWIPVNETNSDYQRYLNPEEEQPTPNVGGNN